MQILIKSPAGDETILCDGPARGLDLMQGPLSDGVEIDDQHNFQESGALRAAAIVYYDRGNGRVATGFQVARESASAAAGHAFQMQFHLTCVRAGALYIIQDDGKWLFPTAVLNFKSKPMGVTRLYTFTIQAGAPTIA